MANGPAEAAKMFRISDASIIGDGFGGPTKKGRPVSRASGRWSGQANGCRLRHDCRGPEATRAETIALHRRAKLGTSLRGFTPMGGGMVWPSFYGDNPCWPHCGGVSFDVDDDDDDDENAG